MGLENSSIYKRGGISMKRDIIFFSVFFGFIIFFATSYSNPRLPKTLAPVRIGDKWGYIDRTGKFVIKPRFDDAGWFHEGLAAVKIGDKWGYIDRTGKFVIKPRFDGAGDFHEGLALVVIGDDWGYINKTGKFVIKPQFDDARDFSKVE
jgi:hypothetical protein